MRYEDGAIWREAGWTLFSIFLVHLHGFVTQTSSRVAHFINQRKRNQMTSIKTSRSAGRMAAAAIVTLFVAGCAVNTQPAPVATPGPQGAQGTADGCKADRLGDKALIGKPEGEVVALLAGCPWRIGMRDGKRFPGTMDYLENRRTLSIVNGRVVEIKRG